MIIEEYDESLFISRFEDYKRVVNAENPNGNFSYRGLTALYNYLDEIYTQENPYNLDVIGLCCDFSEYKNIEEYLNYYYTTEEINQKLEEIKQENEDANAEEIKEIFNKIIEDELNEKTILIKLTEDINEGFIIQNF